VDTAGKDSFPYSKLNKNLTSFKNIRKPQKKTQTWLAQSAERQPFKLVVEGSSPSSGVFPSLSVTDNEGRGAIAPKQFSCNYQKQDQHNYVVRLCLNFTIAFVAQ